MDTFNYENSKTDGLDENIYNNKTWLNVNDTNSGAYSTNQINFQLSQIYNQNSLINWSSAYIAVPLTLKITSSVANAIGSTNIYNLVSMKNLYSLVNSLVLSVDGKTISNSSNNLNNFIIFRLLTENRLEDLNNEDPNISVDDCLNIDDFVYSGTKSFNDIVNSNGFKKKTLQFKNMSNFELLKTANNKKLAHLSNVTSISTTEHILEFVACLKLRYLSDYFLNCGNSRQFIDNLTLNVNCGSSTYTAKASIATGSAFNSAAFNITSSFQYNSCPFCIDLSKNTGGNLVDGSTIKFDLQISNTMIKNCVFYAKSLQYNPSIEAGLLDQETRDFYYRDVYFNNTTVSKGASLNFTTTNSQSNLKGILIIPYLNSASNKNNDVAISQLASPTNSYGTAPLVTLDNLNILIGGKNLQPNNYTYNYNTFLNNVQDLGSLYPLNSNNCINLNMWNINHKYYYFNLEEADGDNSGISKSVIVKCQNNNEVDLDLHMFIIYKKSVKMNKLTGKILELF